MQPDVKHALDSLASRTAENDAWRPEILSAGDPETGRRLTLLLESGGIRQVHDTLLEQLRELMDTRDPANEHIPDEELDRRARAHLGDTPAEAYGNWVWYPWSLRLVHVLPEAEFAELRHARNRNKVTEEEQARLLSLRIGVVGLSVGQSSAITLAMEGVGGEYRLADFDRLDLSNTNRLRAGVHDLGVHKGVLTARFIYEMNPYARVTLFADGLTDENMEAFLGGLDFVVEEADDLYMKVKIREAARRARIPVIMETSDRGLVDVERFDKEPERPILHGLVGDVEAESLRGLDTTDKVPVVLNILDQSAISTRLAASMVDVGTSLKSWPQLASAISLGAAIVTDTVRRMALGQFNESGRFYVDLDEIIRDGGARAFPTRHDFTTTIIPESTRVEAPAVRRVTSKLGEEEIRTLVRYGVMAPSGGNIQPWRFESRDGGLRLIHDVERSRSFLDFQNLASYLTLGAVVENIDLTAAEMGLAARVEPFPVATDPLVVADIRFEPAADGVGDPRLFEQIPHRVTNRKLGKRVPMDPAAAEALAEAAAFRGGRLGLCTDDEGLEKFGRMLGRGDRVRFLHQTMHREMMGEIRWTPEEVERTRDGLDVATLELTAADLAGMRLTSNWRVMDLVGRFGAGRGLEKPSKKGVASASAVGLVTFPGLRPVDYFEGGRALQRVWLAAGAFGYAFQPMTAITYVFARLERGAGEGLSDDEKREVAELRAIQDSLIDRDPGHAEIMLFRLAKVGEVTARSLRRPVDEVLTF